MFKNSVTFLIYEKAKSIALRVFGIFKAAASESRAVYFLLYPRAIEESAAYMVLSIPSKTLEGFAKKGEGLKECLANSRVYMLLREPQGLPLSFFAPLLIGLFWGLGYYYGLLFALCLAFYKRPLLASRPCTAAREAEGFIIMLWWAAMFLAGLYAEEWGLYLIICAFILANPKTGFFVVTALSMFIPPEPLCIISVAAVYSFFLRAAVVPKTMSPPRKIDVLIYIFAFTIYAFDINFWREISLYRALLALVPVLYFAAALQVLKDREMLKTLSMTYIVSAAIMSAVPLFKGEGVFVGSLKNDMRAFGEFYVLSIPFAFVHTKMAKGTTRAVCSACLAFLCISFLQNLSRGAVTGSILALGMYLVLRDIRYLIPAALTLGVILSLIYGPAAERAWGLLSRASEFEYAALPAQRGTLPVIISGVVWALMAALIYSRIQKDSDKKPFIRSLTSAAAGGSAGLAASGGSWGMYRINFVFWVLLSLFSARLEEKNL